MFRGVQPQSEDQQWYPELQNQLCFRRRLNVSALSGAQVGSVGVGGG